MTIPVPSKKLSPLSLTQREWLQRVRGTTLSQMADQANQACFRQGFNYIHKSWTSGFDRSNTKTDGAGHVTHNIALTSNASRDYYIDIPYTHPGATQVALILTYMAPDEAGQSLVGAQTTAESKLSVKLIDGSGNKVDPTPSSNQTSAFVLIGSRMPQPRIISSVDNTYESVVGGNLSVNHLSAFNYGYSARILRTVCYIDRSANFLRPKRLNYASGQRLLTVVITAEYAALLEANAFEIPKLFV